MKNPQLDLPEIPSLPPLELSTSPSPPSSIFRHSRDSLFRRSSPSPLASQVTSAPSRTSPGEDPNGIPATILSEDLLHPPSPTSVTTPSALRKSLSVDSFVKSKQSPIGQVTRTSRGQTMSSHRIPPQELRQRAIAPSHPVDQASGSSRISLRERDKRVVPPPPPSSRSRATSISTNVDEREGSSFFDESDVERSENISRRSRKSKTTSRQFVLPPGELGLPSRLQAMSSSPNMNSTPPPAPIVPVRSSSLNHRSAKNKASMSVDTHIPPSPHLSQPTIAVIGSAGCGKSTITRKGLKNYEISESIMTHIFPQEMDLDYNVALPCTFLRWRLSSGPDATSRSVEASIRVAELDIAIFRRARNDEELWQQEQLFDGFIFCYDSTREDSFAQIADCLRDIAYMNLPTVVVACKSDLEFERRVDPGRAFANLQQYDVGLVEVTVANLDGRDKIRRAFEWLVRAIKHDLPRSDRDGYQNPASPSMLGSAPPWDVSRASSATPTAASATSYIPPSHSAHAPLETQTYTDTPPQSESQLQISTPMPNHTFRLPSVNTATTSRIPSTPTSPTRARSTSDLLSEHEKSKREEREQYSVGRSAALSSSNVRSRSSLNALASISGSGDGLQISDDPHEAAREASARESRVPPWLTLEELLNKMLFMAVSDDDPLYVTHFLLTYRRFATPRSILLAMQKRIRALDQPSGDPMICLLLDQWIHAYPNDFAVPNTSGALIALVKSVVTKSHLVHYGTDFLPFLDTLADLKDRDQTWALKIEEESDDSSWLSEEDGYRPIDTESPASSNSSRQPLHRNSSATPPAQPSMTRDRKSSLPLTAKALAMGQSMLSPTNSDGTDQTPKQVLRRLVQVSEEVQKCAIKDIVNEITRIEVKFFLDIKPRHWLQHVLAQGKKDPETDPIAKYNHVSNHIADWVVSLILCHDKAKARARQIEKFVQVAHELRVIHNYSALRAVIAGINSATFEGDESLDIVRGRSQETWKIFQSYDQLLRAVRSHQKYRMALKNTKGPCIPALEIHLSDLIRAHEGNTDYHDEDPTKIHWAKFNMMARFIDVICQCQERCRTHDEPAYMSDDLRPPPEYLLFKNAHMLMDIDMQRSRIAPPESDVAGDTFRPIIPRTYSRDPHQPRDPAYLRKIAFW
ncbi:uncharacterized protein FIBRA_04044 [Fibroporia radiculosa]|uniref:Ras GEF n=1 Tax=Fibroporia radiculosa TaxID=599839 RepID=J4I9Y5_9APHY|nr:uncharacterized protein FIBRA_04044 [Fibroporia radiculosa]CCM01971.1 predicted protein [Fibroporia radiculosa]